MPETSATAKEIVTSEGSVFKQKDEFEEHALESDLTSQRTAEHKT